MPRKPRSVKDVNAPQESPEFEPQPTLTEEQAAASKAPPKDRNTQGQFVRGNPGGPGNPHARSCARMLEVFRNAVSEEDMLRIVNKMIEKAANGDACAAKLIVAYCIGKPLPGHHPDSIDRDEWDHYQKDAMNDKEMKLVMSALPTSVGNDIARVSLPIMTAARTHDLAMQLREGCPVPETPAPTETASGDANEEILHSESQRDECDGVETSGNDREEKAAPLPNGKLDNETVEPSAKKEPLPNGVKNEERVQRSTRNASPSTTNLNGKKMDGKKMRKPGKRQGKALDRKMRKATLLQS
jgi:hypothetical protein